MDKYRINRAIIKGAYYLYCKLIHRVKITGKENIPKEGAVLFCANHRSYLDPVVISTTCKRDDTRFLAKEELTKNPYFAHLARVFNVIFVKRNSKDIGPMKEGLKTLKNGKCIALFPEGTRNGMQKGEKAKTGVSYFALNSDAVVIPIGIKGAEKPFKKLYITYGKPIDLSGFKENKKDKEVIEKATEAIMDKIIELTK